MLEPRRGLIYNQEKAGLTGPSNVIAQKIVDASKNTKYYEYQKKRSDRIDRAAAEIKAKLQNASIAERDFAALQVNNYIETLKKKLSFEKVYIHADLDMFFAAVEALLDPSLKGIPFAVGGSIKHGIISTSSYEARKFGVRSGMAVFVALKLCPDLKIVPYHGEKYVQLSKQVKEVFAKYDPNYVSYGLDEATLDITELVNNGQNMEEIARSIQREVYEATKLTISIGVAHSRQLAKISSDINKPNGIFVAPREETALLSFISTLPVRKIPGVGGVTEQILKEIGVNTIKDVIEKRVDIWLTMKQNFCEFIFSSAMGIPKKYVEYGPQQSISKDRTFESTNDRGDLMGVTELLASKVVHKMEKMHVSCRTVTLKLKNTFFQLITRSYTFDHDVNKLKDITDAALKMLIDELNISTTKYRLLGVSVSSLTKPGEKRQSSIKSFIKKVESTVVEKTKEKERESVDKNVSGEKTEEKESDSESEIVKFDEETDKESEEESEKEPEIPRSQVEKEPKQKMSAKIVHHICVSKPTSKTTRATHHPKKNERSIDDFIKNMRTNDTQQKKKTTLRVSIGIKTKQPKKTIKKREKPKQKKTVIIHMRGDN